jgi:hypothetical protein
MKWVIVVTGVVICAIAFMYYLLTNEFFVPFDRAGEYNWLNIAVLVSLITVVFSLIVFLLSMLVLSMLKRGMRMRRKAFISMEVALFSSVGLPSVIALNFFHTLEWKWGMGALGIAIILLFIILFPHDKKEKQGQQ